MYFFENMVNTAHPWWNLADGFGGISGDGGAHGTVIYFRAFAAGFIAAEK